MRWFDNWIRQKYNQQIQEAKQDMSPINAIGRPSRIDGNGMTFTVYRANGGHVIETRTYNRKTDITDHTLHIITDDKDLGEEIGKIITYESLRS